MLFFFFFVAEAGSVVELRRLKQRWHELHQTMNGLTCSPDISLEEFYQLLETTDTEFYNSLRASLDRPKVFLKRKVNEMWINS